MPVRRMIIADIKRYAGVFTREVSNRCIIGAMVFQTVLCYSAGFAGGAMCFEAMCRESYCVMRVYLMKVIGHKYE